MRRTAIVFTLLVLTIPRPAESWGFSVHRELSQNSITALPDAWKTYFQNLEDEILDASVNPDLRKSSDPAERARHYDDQDVEHRDRDVPASSKDYSLGVVAWAAENATSKLTKALREDNQSAIIRYAGDVAHYVADAAQPLHATGNYDGQLTGNGGIHSRYESEMIRRYISKLFSFSLNPDLSLVPDPYALVEEQIASGLEAVPQILDADDKARAQDPKKGDTYYSVLYQETKNLTKQRLRMAAQNIANLWYTALVNSGSYVPPTDENSTAALTSTQVSSLTSSQDPVNNTLESPLTSPYVPALLATTSTAVLLRRKRKN